jgi:hypothetical protein
MPWTDAVNGPPIDDAGTTQLYEMPCLVVTSPTDLRDFEQHDLNVRRCTSHAILDQGLAYSAVPGDRDQRPPSSFFAKH